jgi:hypothetical protein
MLVMADTTVPAFARNLGIRRLYHYQKFRAEHLSSMLRERKIFCSNPAHLNDPWDCRPSFDPAPMKDPEVFQQVMAWFHRQAQVPIEDRLKQQLEDRLKSDKDYMAQFADTLSQEFHKMIFKRRLYCLTTDPACTLMWSHYTDNHCGICLEFSTDVLMFGNAMKVIYRPTYPSWITYLPDPARTLEMVLTKSEAWEYEQEFRVWTVSESTPSPYLRPQGNYLALPDGALTSVIAGCEADYDAIRAIVHVHLPGLPVKCAVRIPHQYKLSIEE